MSSVNLKKLFNICYRIRQCSPQFFLQNNGRYLMRLIAWYFSVSNLLLVRVWWFLNFQILGVFGTQKLLIDLVHRSQYRWRQKYALTQLGNLLNMLWLILSGPGLISFVYNVFRLIYFHKKLLFRSLTPLWTKKFCNFHFVEMIT